jgi:streptogramin lyase
VFSFLFYLSALFAFPSSQREPTMFWPFCRNTVRPKMTFRFRPQITALEDRLVPSTITEFTLPPLTVGGQFGAGAVTAGPDGNVWFTDPFTNEIGRITPEGQVTEFTAPFGRAGVITAGPDGNLWFSTGDISARPAIGRVTPDGQFATFPIPDQLAGVAALTAGPDGNVWFTELIYPNEEKVGRITPTGQLTQFSITVPPGTSASPGSITTGPDGNLYFSHDGILASISPNGAIRDHIAENVPFAITTGPDGNIWASGPRFDPQTGVVVGDIIERISPQTGSVTTFNVGTASGSASSISAGPDGNLWFTEPDADEIGRITPSGQITLFNVPTAGSEPTGIVAGPNGNIWFTEAASRHIGEYFLTGTPPQPAAPTTTALAVDVSAPQVGQPVHLTATVASAAGTPAGTVTFFDGTSAIGTASLNATGQAALSAAFKTSGSHSVTAVFNGTAEFAPSQSAALKEAVSEAVTTTTLAASANPAPVGHTLVLTVTVTPAFTGAGAPTGTIMLRDGTNVLAIAELDSSGKAVFTFIPGQVIRNGRTRITILPRGIHHLTAEYSGDGNFAFSRSSQVNLTVV